MGCRALLIYFCLVLTACGQKKIAGPLPEAGDVSLRVLHLVDPALPALSDADVRKALDLAGRQMSAKLGRTVRFEDARREDLQTTFDRWMKPFGKVSFAPRLDPSRAVAEEEKRILYARILDLLRNGRLRPMFPLFSLDPAASQVPDILDKIMQEFETSLEKLRKSGYLPGDLNDRQSVFAWYLLLGSMPSDSKPADLILTNDLLIFDSISTFPPSVFASGGVTTGYTRVYPGVTVVSTLPIIADGSWADGLRGDVQPERRLSIVAGAISSEVGGKMIQMNQDELDHTGCLTQSLIRPYAKTLEDIEQTTHCAREHKPLNRRQLLTDYLEFSAKKR